jgi:hypothetical protein
MSLLNVTGIIRRGTTITVLLCALTIVGQAQSGPTMEVAADWSKTIASSKSVPSLQVVVTPMLRPASPIHDQAYAALKELGADYVRFVPYFVYPRLSVAELEPPTQPKTSWDFSLIDPPTLDFLRAVQGHPAIWNFSAVPAWMFKTEKPVTYPADPNQASYDYEQGTELVDPTGAQLGDYYARLVSWYTQGGFTDENGSYHKSGYHYELPWWEVFNEPDAEHTSTPEQYTRRYDAIVAAIKKVSPKTKFVGLALGSPSYERGDLPGSADMYAHWFEYFLDSRNHRPGTPLDMISYHFYSMPGPTESLDQWQYSFFSQADKYVSMVGLIECIRKRLSPSTRTAIDEIGTFLTKDATSPHPAPIPAGYWNLSGATYAYLYMKLSALETDVLNESALVAHPGFVASVSMIDWTNGKPNARYWVLKLIKDNFGPGDALVSTRLANSSANMENIDTFLYPDVAAQAYRTKHGQRKLLLVNKRNRAIQIAVPPDAVGGRLETVDEATGEGPARASTLNSPTIELAPFAVAVATLH